MVDRKTAGKRDKGDKDKNKKNDVQEASEDSFPASDPPAWIYERPDEEEDDRADDLAHEDAADDEE